MPYTISQPALVKIFLSSTPIRFRRLMKMIFEDFMYIDLFGWYFQALVKSKELTRFHISFCIDACYLLIGLSGCDEFYVDLITAPL